MKDFFSEIEQVEKNLEMSDGEANKLIDTSSIQKDGQDYVVAIPLREGRAEIRYSELSAAVQSLTAVVTVRLFHSKDGALTPFSQRLDLNSQSAGETFRRSLDNGYGKQHQWTIVLNKAYWMLKEKLIEDERPQSVAGAAFVSDPFLIMPFLQKDACNMVFGDSEVGKSFFSIRMAVSLAAGIPFMGFEAPKGARTLFLDYEDSIRTFNSRLFQMCSGLGIDKDTVAQDILWYHPKGSLRDTEKIISRMVIDGKFDLIIIDAGSNAAGGSPNDEQKVIDMFNAIENIPCTKLIIHHEPKTTTGISDEKAYYGTTFWRALVRIAWRLVLENTEEGKLIKAVLVKNSNIAPVPPFFYRQKWHIPDDGPDGQFLPYSPVTFERVDTPEEKSTRDRIIDCLREHGELSRTQIADMICVSSNTVKVTLQRLKDDGQIVCKGSSNRALWKLK